MASTPTVICVLLSTTLTPTLTQVLREAAAARSAGLKGASSVLSSRWSNCMGLGLWKEEAARACTHKTREPKA